MSKQTILVVDDEHDLLDLIEYNLEKENFKVLKTDNGKDGIALAKQHHPSLIVLDVMMPNMDGHQVCEILKADSKLKSIPVVFLTARSDEKTEVKSLDRGADDYLTKPISTTKLISRIKMVLRRFEGRADEKPSITVHGLIINRDKYVVIKDGVELQLPRKEFELLYFLANRTGKVFSRQTLLNEIWGNNVYVIDRTVDVHIRKIREKLGSEYIETVKGVGYRFKE